MTVNSLTGATWPDTAAGDFAICAVPLFGPDPNDPPIVRAYVAEGLCPFCGAGPFAVVAGHTQRMHDVDALALRAICGVPKQASICDPGHSAAVRRRARSRWSPEQAERMRLASRGTQRQLSAAGKARLRSTVASAKAVQNAKASAARERLVARFLDLGGDYAATEALAVELGRPAFRVRERLRAAGAAVPNGWQVSPRKHGGKPVPPELRRRCEADGCDRIHVARGLCGMHYQRQKAAEDR